MYVIERAIEIIARDAVEIGELAGKCVPEPRTVRVMSFPSGIVNWFFLGVQLSDKKVGSR